VTSVFKIRKNS